MNIVELKEMVTWLKANSPELVKPPMLRPSFNPFDFQTPAIAMMYLLPRMVVGYDVGLGKTAITISAYAQLQTRPEGHPGKLMVFSPRSALYQWQEEIEKFSYYKPFVVDAGEMSKPKRQAFYEERANDYDVIITTYSLMYRDVYLYRHLLPTAMVAWDEVLNLKNDTTKLYQTAQKHFTRKVPRIYGLSATILKNNLLEPFNIFRLIVPSQIPTVDDFKSEFCIYEKKHFGHRTVHSLVGHKNIKEFADIIYPFYIGRKKTEIGSQKLPKVVVRPLYLHLTRRQLKLYKDAVLEIQKEELSEMSLSDIDQIDAEEAEDLPVMVKMIKCQQICDSPYLVGEEGPSSKEKRVLDLLKEDVAPGEKTIIFTRFKAGVERLKEVLKDYKPLAITGDITSAKTRNEIRKSFVEGSEHDVLLITLAAKEALNLQAAKHLVFYNLDWSYGDNLQIIGRLNRLGSDHEINYVYILINKDTVDEYVYNTVMKKEQCFVEFLGDVGYHLNSDKLQVFCEKFQKFNARILNL